ncbi:dienelactone hydrolase family protein [Cellulomonas cellasea]|uniref:Dienelactone hydrolase n=2 Tax=Cellulomonas cellasea TaxID=43670 RepID=A0A0A0B2H6_9CELL|nr:dienelactone hydrolase family protein [Cellulomonas cellasea]KGM00995.1 dienelactone hydrolase [Cellulomonas cellasea DSM 20118]GEA86798.1 dienelactone hydrolase [Cellulomonas cellasea]
MAEVLLFHHVLGQTEGFHAFADELRAAGHVVHTPDLFDGATFPTVEAGIRFAGQTGFDVLGERGVRAAEGLPDGLVHAGISFGVMAAQRLAQTRPGARGAVLLESCLPASEFGAWPSGVPVQVHGMSEDPFFAGEGDIDAARALVAEAEDGELFVYPGDQHLFTDRSLPSCDAAAAALVTERVLAFLARLE